MTENTSQPIAAGWYADHSDPALQRWWDGTKWTEHTQQAYVAGGTVAALKAPEGTKWSTPWIWLILLLPLLGLFSLFTININGYMEALITDPSNIGPAMAALFSPGFIIAVLLGWVVTALTIWFAYLDYKELERRGVPKPFHWAFGFLALAGYGIVYPIGRGVVTNRRGAGGIVVTWIAIAALVLSFIIAIVWTVVIMTQAFALIPPVR